MPTFSRSRLFGSVSQFGPRLVAAESGTVNGSFTADAVLRRTIDGSFTVDAFIRAAGTGDFKADAILRRTIAASFTVDSWVAFAAAFPQVAEVTSGTQTTNSSDWDLTYPSGLEEGDLILAFLAVDGSEASTPDFSDSGWHRRMRNPLEVGIIAAAKISDGTETGTFTVTHGANEQGAWRVYRITGWFGSGLWADSATNDAGFVSINGTGIALAIVDYNGTPSTTPSFSGGLNPSQWGVEKTLWIAAMAADASPTISAFPTNYTNTSADVSGGSAGATLGLARRESEASSETPGAYTISASEQWATFLVAIRPGEAGSRFAAFSADAVIKRTQEASFTVDAVLTDSSTHSNAFLADAVIRRVIAASLTADAVLRRSGTAASFTADAWISGSYPITVDAVIRKSTTGSFTASAWIYSPRADPGGPGEPGETPLVSIIVDGVDITHDVILSDATFTMLVNGAVGQFRFRVRDDGHTYSFVSGSEVTVDIDGLRRFGGYLMQPKRMFAFPVVDTTDPDNPSRFHVLEGVDYNILLTKRVVYDHDDPTNVSLRSWPSGSHDDVVIKYVFDNYTDLADDGVTTGGVTHIGSPNPDRKGVVGSGGLRFVDLLREVNRLISGVYYIDPYKVLNYVDVDTPNATVGLSDNPVEGEAGYRELEQVENGTGLVNDAMVWGAGAGSPRLAFGRAQDSASQAEHGLWQFGEFTNSLFRQASVNLRSDTIVNGTPQSKRGGKDDQESWLLTVYEPTYVVGMKVAVESEVFGKADVLPIRKMTITFPSKRRPKFQLTLSHEIDEPWNMFEFLFPKFGFDLEPPVIELPPNPGDEACFEDLFDRTVSGTTGWGTADSGEEWEPALGGQSINIDSGPAVDSGVAKLFDKAGYTAPADNVGVAQNAAQTIYPGCDSPPIITTIKWSASGSFEADYAFRESPYNPGVWHISGDVGGPHPPSTGVCDPLLGGCKRAALFLRLVNSDATLNLATIGISIDATGAYWALGDIGSVFPTFPAPISFNFGADEVICVKFFMDATSVKAKLWNEADPEPDDWEMEHGTSGGTPDLENGVTAAFRRLAISSRSFGALEINFHEFSGRVTAQEASQGFGENAEEPTTADQTTYQLAQLFTYGSTRVFVNGDFQRPGIEYTESPSTGQIVFTNPLDPSDVVRVIYFHDGDL